MFKVRVIPCLDVKDGRVVKGVNFVDLRDAGDPVEAAIAYDAAGADELCFLDITATHENRGTMLDVVRRTAEACFMPLTVGGGVRTIDDIKTLLDLHPWRAQLHRDRRHRIRAGSGIARRRRNPADVNGPRRHTAGVRPAADAGHRRQCSCTGYRLRRRRQSRPPRRRHPPGPRHSGVGGLDIPLRRIYHTPSQGAHGARRAADAARSLTTPRHKSAKSLSGTAPRPSAGREC